MAKKRTTVKSQTKKTSTKKPTEKKQSQSSNKQFAAFDDVGKHVHNMSMNFVTESMKITEQFMQCRTFDDFVKLQMHVMDNYSNFVFGEVSKLGDTVFNSTIGKASSNKSKDFGIS